MKDGSYVGILGEMFQAERIVSANVLEQEHVWCVGGTPGGQYGENRMIRGESGR